LCQQGEPPALRQTHHRPEDIKQSKVKPFQHPRHLGDVTWLQTGFSLEKKSPSHSESKLNSVPTGEKQMYEEFSILRVNNGD
jgi:hypothetical protein